MSPLYTQLNVLKIQELYYYNLGTLAYDYFNSPTFPDLLKEKFDNFRVESTHATRSQGMNLNYKIPDSFKTYREPCIASSMFWNSIPNEVRVTKTRISFKSKLKAFLISRYEVQ